MQIGIFIFQDSYRIPGDNELVASVNGQILNQKKQHFSNRDRGGLQTVMSVLHVKEKKNPYTLVVQITFITRGQF